MLFSLLNLFLTNLYFLIVIMAEGHLKVLSFQSTKIRIFAARQNCLKSGCGVIGSRARLRIWCREAWGFESLHPHRKSRILD